MKTFAKLTSALALAVATNSFAVDEKGWASTYESLAAFDKNIIYYGNRPGYVKPLINNLGNVLNSNWYVSSEVAMHPAFEAGLPFAIIPIGDDEKTFWEPSFIDGSPMESPTIFGDHAPLVVDNGFGQMVPDYNDFTVYGNETLNGLGVFTYPYLQVAASAFHARVVLRGMWLPAISELQKFNLLGFGLQYSFGHLFQYMLPPAAQGLNVSLALGYSSSGISYQPEDFSGSLDLDISAFTFDVVIGYKLLSFIEIMMTLGYQSAEMASSGQLTCEAKNPDGTNSLHYGKVINPNLTVDGNNGFKFGLAVAFQLGSSFHPVIGFDYAGKSSYTTNVLYFKQQFGSDKTPDEIAKEKGYVRGAKAEKSAPEEKVESTRQNEDDETAPMNTDDETAPMDTEDETAPEPSEDSPEEEY